MTIVNRSHLKQLISGNTVLIDCRNLMDKFDESETLVQSDPVHNSVHIPQMPYMFKFDGVDEGRHPLPETSVIDALYDALSRSSEFELLLFADENSFFHTRLYFLFLLYGHDVYLYNDDIESLREVSGEFENYEAELPMQFDSADISFRRDIHRSMDDLTRKMDDDVLLLDVRSEERYLGITEPVDYKMGHIPGAVNIPNDRIFKDGKLDLHALDDHLEIFKKYEEVMVYCGSGMSATPMFTLLYNNGINAKLYAGSFSEWITEDTNIVETSPNTLPEVSSNEE